MSVKLYFTITSKVSYLIIIDLINTIGVRCDLYYDIRCSVYNLTESKSKQNRALIIAGFKV